MSITRRTLLAATAAFPLAAAAPATDPRETVRAAGDPKAKVTVMEFFSLTCPHCAAFARETFPRIRTELIATGKVYYIFGDYPLDQVALNAAMLARALPDPRRLTETAAQALDDRAERLALALPALVSRRRASLEQAGGRLPGSLRQSVARTHTQAMRVLARLSDAPVRALLARDRALLDQAATRLPGALRQSVGRMHTQAMRVLARLSDAPLRAELRAARSRLAGLSGHLEAVSPLAILSRGYALVTDRAGAPITQAAEVTPGKALRIRFADGEVSATADGAKPGDRQGRLGL